MADDQALIELSEYIADQQEQAILRSEVANGELCIYAQAAHIASLITFLRDDPQCLFKVLIDICGVDYPEREQRFDVVYQLLSLHHNQRIRIKIHADGEIPVPSITGVHSAADWFERETWDMYGVMFADHPDLRRLLTDYGFEGHPLRKDFPLTGFVEVRYDEEQKRVLYEPVKLAQEFRTFDFMSPWEGAEYILPGDEKAGEQE